MFQAIVFLPLLGAIIAGLIALFGAHQRYPGGEPGEHAEADHHAPAAGHAFVVEQEEGEEDEDDTHAYALAYFSTYTPLMQGSHSTDWTSGGFKYRIIR